MSDIERMIRTRQVQDAALAEVNDKISACKGALQSFKELSDKVTTLPEKMSYDVMVEFGKYAFMPGKLVHTNELMVHLGDAYFASMTCKQAMKIIQLRSTNLENTLTDLEKVASNIVKKADYLGEMNQEAQKDLIEIREECPESYKHPKDRRRVSRVKEPAAAETTTKTTPAQAHESLMSRLDELQRLEDEEDQMDRSLVHSDDSPINQPINKAASHEVTTTSSLQSNMTYSQVSNSHPSKVKKVHFEDSTEDNEIPTIKFRHSNVKPKAINDMTPGDIKQSFVNPKLKTAPNEPQHPIKVAAISDVIVERPMAATKQNLKANREERSKSVSKFKASRMKQWD